MAGGERGAVTSRSRHGEEGEKKTARASLLSTTPPLPVTIGSRFNTIISDAVADLQLRWGEEERGAVFTPEMDRRFLIFAEASGRRRGIDRRWKERGE